MDNLDLHIKELAAIEKEIVPAYVENKIQAILDNLPVKDMLLNNNKTGDINVVRDIIFHKADARKNPVKKNLIKEKFNMLLPMLKGVGVTLLILFFLAAPMFLLHMSGNKKGSTQNAEQASGGKPMGSVGTTTGADGSKGAQYGNKLFEKDKIKVEIKETIILQECRMKNGPGSSYEDIGDLKYGNIVLLEGSYNGWYLVKTADYTECWIDGKNVLNYNDEGSRLGIITVDEMTVGNVKMRKGDKIRVLLKSGDNSYVKPAETDAESAYTGWINNSDYKFDK